MENEVGDIVGKSILLQTFSERDIRIWTYELETITKLLEDIIPSSY